MGGWVGSLTCGGGQGGLSLGVDSSAFLVGGGLEEDLGGWVGGWMGSCILSWMGEKVGG